MKKLLLFATMLLSATAAQAADELVTLPAGVEAEEYTLAITHAISQQEGTTDTDKKITVKVAFDGNDVYLQGLAYYFPEAYVKGTLADGRVTVASGQFVGQDMYGPEYLTGFTLDAERNVLISDFYLDFEAATRNLYYDPSVFAAETNVANDPGAALYCYVKEAVYTPGALPPLVAVEVPDDLQAEPCLLIATQTINEENDNGEFELVAKRYEIPVQVGFSGNDLYIQGLIENVSYAWVKATKNAQGNYVIPQGQYIGTQTLYNQAFNYFISATSRFGSLTDVVFAYNAESGTLTSSQTIAPTSSADKADAYYTLNNVSIKKIVEREAVPSMPEMVFKKQNSPYGSAVWYYSEMFLPLTDTEGRPMLADKLAFVFLCDKGDGQPEYVTFPSKKFYELDTDVTEMAYTFQAMPDFSNHTVYFEKLGLDVLQTWHRLGLQTIYRGMGIEHRSDIAWFDLTPFWGISGIDNAQTSAPKAQSDYDLQGRRIDGNASGLVLRRTVNADGTVSVRKFIRK